MNHSECHFGQCRFGAETSTPKRVRFPAAPLSRTVQGRRMLNSVRNSRLEWRVDGVNTARCFRRSFAVVSRRFAHSHRSLYAAQMAFFHAGARGSSPLTSTHFHRRLSATEPVDDASAMRPLSDVGEPAVGLYLHGAHLVRSRRIRHFMPTTGVPAPQDPHKTADRRHPGGDHRRPHQYLSQPHAPLNSDDPLLRVPKSGQLIHAHRDAHDRLGENARHGEQCRRRSI